MRTLNRDSLSKQLSIRKRPISFSTPIPTSSLGFESPIQFVHKFQLEEKWEVEITMMMNLATKDFSLILLAMLLDNTLRLMGHIPLKDIPLRPTRQLDILLLVDTHQLDILSKVGTHRQVILVRQHILPQVDIHRQFIPVHQLRLFQVIGLIWEH